ncbi:MAG TPA: malto-oligosyltrehalose synthase [Candidatus Corynebacterium gallistercoris]|uniref:Malto-oligosyltrehalose synthase n=1 Tax=Candidatus Corynebacterium gallistercoris TaxID=2838530 RepID=A0A9D1UQQ9_9CORY|nr:malto-oligosyltrehalose synthase [Candidatus Corynebacterium gallistercoris]
MSATYRLQLRGPASDPDQSFVLSDAAALTGYLAELGVSHLYLSPIMAAPPDSTHGYDVTDPTVVNPELGGIEELRRLREAARAQGLGIIVDIVPNHVGVDVPVLNAWWWDVLTHGQGSRYAGFFDINWGAGKLTLPVLGSAEDRDKVTVDGGELRYYEHRFPIAPGTEGGTAQEVLDRQHYQLVYWKTGAPTYRRFFSINGLAGVRQEDRDVFEHTHSLIKQWVDEDLIDGVRVDHPDGLAEPTVYLRWLRELVGEDRTILVEKILGVDEPLDPTLPVQGTTGYDALREFDGVYYHPAAADMLADVAEKHTGSRWDEQECTVTEVQMKLDVARGELAPEVSRLCGCIGADVSREAVEELLARMPVYRGDYPVLEQVIPTVLAQMDRVEDTDVIAAALAGAVEPRRRFAQVCGAVMAKGVEDTTFYRASRLVSLQEVGGAPGRFGLSAGEFHLRQAHRLAHWPEAMTCLSTHDTKRGEDVRARIIAITEAPEDFARLCQAITGPHGPTCHFLLQNIIGVWPVDGLVDADLRQRLHAYATKAMREAGWRTTWADVDEDFEAEILRWIDEVIDTHGDKLTAFVGAIHRTARCTSDSRKLLQLVAPGIPDVYQGTEDYTDHLVDPDNRRPVDFAALQASLDTPRLNLVRTALRVRADHDLDHAAYTPLLAEGAAADHVMGFRRGEDVAVLTARWLAILDQQGGWGDTTVSLPEGEWVNTLAPDAQHVSGVVNVTELFADRPQALLIRKTAIA